jgi:conjugative relaxase-like TrwC/TraI family protein
MAVSLKKVSGSRAAGYYQEYLGKESEETRGQWAGSGARECGLTGEIPSNSPELLRLMEGRHPTEPEATLRQGNNTTRVVKGQVLQPVAAWDITITPPKSVSVEWALNDEKRPLIEGAHRAAVQKTIQTVEDNYCFTRTGAGGRKGREKVEPFFAVYEHQTSRENDPNLHSHVLLFNAALRPNGKGGAIDRNPFMGQGQNALVHKLNQVYTKSLQTELERQGYKTVPTQHKRGASFELAHVPKEVRDTFSTRRKQIEAVIKETDSSKEVELKVLQTRKAKDHDTPKHELFAGWKAKAKALGYQPERKQEPKPEPKKEPAKGKGEQQKPMPDDITLMLNEMLAKKMYWQCLKSVATERKEKVSEAFRKAQIESIERRLAFHRKAELKAKWLRLRGKINRKQYREMTQRQPKFQSKWELHWSHISGKISRKQRDFLLYRNQHITKEQWLKSQPKTKLGINFAYATHQISEKQRLSLLWHRGYIKQEMETDKQSLLPSIFFRHRPFLVPKGEQGAIYKQLYQEDNIKFYFETVRAYIKEKQEKEKEKEKEVQANQPKSEHRPEAAAAPTPTPPEQQQKAPPAPAKERTRERER